MNVVSEYSLKKEYELYCNWVSEKWVIISMEGKEFVLYDIDTGSEQSLYQGDDKWTFESWSATCCNTSTRGLLLYITFYSGRTVHVLALFAAHLITYKYRLQEIARVSGRLRFRTIIWSHHL